MNKIKQQECIIFLQNRINEINQSIKLLSEGKNQIENYLIKLEINDDIINLKKAELTEKIEQLKSMALELQLLIDSADNYAVPLVNYFNGLANANI